MAKAVSWQTLQSSLVSVRSRSQKHFPDKKVSARLCGKKSNNWQMNLDTSSHLP